MGDFLKGAFGVPIVMLIAVAIFTGGYYFIYREAAPAYEAVRHEVYEESTSYVRGKNDHLNRLRLEFETAGEGHKVVLRRVILEEVGNIDRDKLTPELDRFITKLEGEKIR